MSLNHAERHRLHRIESRLLRSDPHLAAMLAVFARLCDGQCMPAGEQLATRLDRIQQSATPIAKAIAIMIAAVRILVIAVHGLHTAIIMTTRTRPPQPAPQQADPGTGGRADPASWT